MVINETKLNAKVEQLFNEIQTNEKNLAKKKDLHLRLIGIQKRTRKIKADDGTITTEPIILIDNDIGKEMTETRRQEIYDEIKITNTGLDI